MEQVIKPGKTYEIMYSEKNMPNKQAKHYISIIKTTGRTIYAYKLNHRHEAVGKEIFYRDSIKMVSEVENRHIQ
jgi:hypothetical protein